MSELGFDPEIHSSLVNRRVVSEHAGESSFLWTQHRKAVEAPHFTLQHLTRLDRRLRAHLAGLVAAGDAGWRAILGMVDPQMAGSIFAIAFFAFESGSDDRVRHATSLALVSGAGSVAFADALAWARAAAARNVISEMQGSSNAAERAIACRALSARRTHDAVALDRAIRDVAADVRELALRAVGETGCFELIASIQNAMNCDESPICRFWAARSLALLGSTDAAHQAYELGLGLSHERQGVEIGMRCGDETWARNTIRALAANGERRRLAVIAAGAFGDPAVLRWLLDQCGDPELGSLAGEAVSMITGVDLRYLDLDLIDIESDDETPPSAAEDQMLPRPDAAQLRSWWESVSSRFAAGTRYLAGHAISRKTAIEVLSSGYQRQRAAAAIELSRMCHPTVLFPIGSPADRQVRRLSA